MSVLYRTSLATTLLLVTSALWVGCAPSGSSGQNLNAEGTWAVPPLAAVTPEAAWRVTAAGAYRMPQPDDTVSVEVPSGASGEARLEDHAAALSIAFKPIAASSARGRQQGAVIEYREAFGLGATLSYRGSRGAIEDTVVLEHGSFQRVDYEVDVSRVAGLRLVSGVLEYLDSRGSPRFRTARPFVRDANGLVRNAELRPIDCAVDEDPRPPWGRTPTLPGRDRCTLRVSWDDAGLAYPISVDPTWSLTGGLGTPRAAHTATLLPTQKGSARVLVLGGEDTNHVALADAEIFDQQDGRWAMAAPLMTARAHHTANLLADGSVLVLGGTNSDGPVVESERYPADGSAPQAEVPLPLGRKFHTATTVSDGSVVVVGGGSLTTLRLIPALTPPSSWYGGDPLRTSLTLPRFNHAAQLVNGRVYVVGGTRSPIDGSPAIADVDSYDPTKGVEGWRKETPMSAARSGHTLTLLNSVPEVMVAVGGSVQPEVFEPISNTWSSTKNSMSEARQDHAAVALDSGLGLPHLLIIGGDQDKLAWSKVNEVYTQDTREWSDSPLTLGQERKEHTATLLNDGRTVLVAGGRSATRVLNDSEVATFGREGDACISAVDCISAHCVVDAPDVSPGAPGICCAESCDGPCETCAKASGSPADGECSPRTAGAVCRASASDCDLVEQCDGMSSACPIDRNRDGKACTSGGVTGICTGAVCQGAVQNAGGGLPGAIASGGEAGVAGPPGSSGGGSSPTGRSETRSPLSCALGVSTSGRGWWSALFTLSLLAMLRRSKDRRTGFAHLRRVSGGILALVALFLVHCGGVGDGGPITSEEGGRGGVTGMPDASACSEPGFVRVSWQRTGGTSGPQARTFHALAALTGDVFLFGGADSQGAALGDFWKYRNQVWSRLQPDTLPQARFGHSLVSTEASLVLFGGQGDTLLNDLWTYRNGMWHTECASPCADGPSPRSGQALAYDSKRGLVVLFGGFDGYSSNAETWEWSAAKGWSLRCGRSVRGPSALDAAAPSAAGATGQDDAGTIDAGVSDCGPPARYGHALAYDPVSQQTVLYGGSDGAKELSDVWLWDGSRWQRASAVPDDLGARTGHAMFFDSLAGTLVAFGGTRGSTPLPMTVWAADGSLAWQVSTAEDGTPPRRSTVVAQPDGGDVVLFSGLPVPSTNADGAGDTWELETQVSTSAQVCDCIVDCEQVCDTSPLRCTAFCRVVAGQELPGCPSATGPIDAGAASGGAGGEPPTSTAEGGESGGSDDAGALSSGCQTLLDCCAGLSSDASRACRATAQKNQDDLCVVTGGACEAATSGDAAAEACVELAPCCNTLPPSTAASCRSVLAAGSGCEDLLHGGFCG